MKAMEQQQQRLLLLMAFVMPFSFSVWMVLINNFSIDVANFTGREIGILQSLREVPGFLAFTVVFALLLIKEQRLALISLLTLAVGIAITGLFPSVAGLYFTTVLMSIGFHYFETLNQSLTLQWVSKEQTPAFMGKALAVKGGAAILAYASLWVLYRWLELDYLWLYLGFGGVSVLAVVYLMLRYPLFPTHHEQHKHLVLRRRYWLYYLLTFFSGARRQIFVVFAGFLMVEKFGYDVADIAALYLINQSFNLLFAAKIGAWIGRVGERKALILEYSGLILVFAGYAVVEHPWAAAGLYVVDHFFFALAIAIKSYLQKIADPQDMASTAGVSFTINHIAAVVLPVVLGVLWLYSPAWVFAIGSMLAALSLLCSLLVPRRPCAEQPTLLAIARS